MFDNLLLHIRKVNGTKILFGRSYRGIVFNSAKIAMETCVVDTEKYIHVYGKYKLIDREVPDFIVINNVSISKQDGQMKLRMHSFGQQLMFNLKELDSNKLEIQGFGRYSGDTITILKTDGEIKIKLLGFEFIKI